MKTISSQLKWLIGLIILAVAILPVGSCTLINQPPIISSLTASEEQIGIYQVKCIASDPNNDSLSYIWSASGGDISGEGPVVTWTAPYALGAYTITVKVIDGRGNEATTQLTINVETVNYPPIIDSLIPKWWKVRKAVSTTIECVASDPDGDELSYIWSTDGGNISGEGFIVTWVAPNAYGDYTVTVTVTDDKGGEASKSITIQVCSCPDAAS